MSKGNMSGGRITNRAGRERPRFIRPVERQRMRPWLVEHLDKNDIPGLTWVDRKEKVFRIAWKHAANQCFNLQKDTNLFERWAIHTGRHYDSDHKRWKANFRCALNSLPDVKENKEQGIKKGNNAFKVYRFLDSKETRGMKEAKVKKKTGYGSDLAFRSNDDDSEEYGSMEPTSFDTGGEPSNIPSIPKLEQLYPTSGVEMLLEAGTKQKVEPIPDSAEDTNLQEILAAATASLAAGSDPAMLESISIDQLKRLGEVSKMRLDMRHSSKKNTSGFMDVYSCGWCEKVFPRKIELFQHFLTVHQDKLLEGEEYGEQQDKSDPKHQKLLEEIQDLELKVLGFSEKSYQSSETGSESIHEDQPVSAENMTGEPDSQEKALDLRVKAKASKSDSKQETALDLSMSSGKKNKSQKQEHGKQVQKRRRSSQESDIAYSLKFGNYGIAGTPRTKRQLSLHTRKKEEEQERLAKKVMSAEGGDTSRQHSMEDIVHAEMLLSLKTGNEEGSDKSSVKSSSKTESNSKGKKGKLPKKQSPKPAKDVELTHSGDDEDENEKKSSIKAFKCGLCYRKFGNGPSLLAHVETHSGAYDYSTVCKTCGQQCDSQDSLLQHISNFHPFFMNQCNFCGKYCKTVKKFKKHMWSHISECGMCGEKFYNAELFEIHLQEQHGVHPDNLPKGQEKSKSISSDDSADDEDEEMDKDSNATTEIAEDSDFDHDKSDGIKVVESCEEHSETLMKDEKDDNHVTETEEKHTVKDDTDIGSNTVVLDVPSFEDSSRHTCISSPKDENDDRESHQNYKVTDSEIPVKNEVNEFEVLNVMEITGYLDKEDVKNKMDSKAGVKVEVIDDDKYLKIMDGTTGGSTSNLTDIFEPEDKAKQTEKWIDGMDEQPKALTKSSSEAKVKALEIIPSDGKSIAGIYRDKAKQLKDAMATAQEGSCFVCSKTLPWTEMEAHVKTHSIVTLSRAKDGLKVLDIEIPALESPLFLCSVCNAGFDSCQSLACHVTKHLIIQPAAMLAAIRKRKIEANKSNTEVKGSKIQKSEPKNLQKTKKANQASTNGRKTVKVSGNTEVKSPGSILAAYLNAGPLYQSSSLVKMAQSSKGITDKPDHTLSVSSKGHRNTGALPLEDHLAQQGSHAANAVDSKEENEKKLVGTQSVTVDPCSSGVVLSLNGKGGSEVQETPKPIPLMFVRDEKGQDLKIVSAPPFLHSSNLKGNQIVKIIPHALVPSPLGEATKSSSHSNQYATVSLTSSDNENLSQAPLSSTVTTVSSLSSIPAVFRNLMVAQSLKGGLKISQVKTVPGVSSGIKTTSESDGFLQNYSPTVIALKTSDLLGAVSKAGCLSNVSQVTATSSVIPFPLQPIVTTALPASISRGQNLPLSLQQQGQVRMITPAGASHLPAQQHITIIQKIHSSNTPTVVRAKQIAVSSSQIQNTESGVPFNVPTPFTVVSSNVYDQNGNKGQTDTTNSQLLQESLLKKTPVIRNLSSVSSSSAVSSSSSPLVSVVKPHSNLMNVMQYIQSQGSLQTYTSVSTFSAVSTAKSTTVESSKSAQSRSSPPKPTFNLVITQTPLTQTTISTGPFSNQQGTSGSHHMNSPNVVTTKDTNTDIVDSIYKLSMPLKGAAPVTNRLALICNLCMTEIQNLEMIGQHVCSTTLKQNSPLNIKSCKEGVVFPCVICNLEFSDLEIILAHQRGHKSDKKPVCVCKLCSKILQTVQSYAAHMKICHSNRLLSCPFCSRAFSDQKSVIKHLQLVHLTEATCYQCSDYNKMYLSATELTLHKIFEHPYECIVCKFRCDTQKDLWIHILNHPKVIKFQRTFNSSSERHDQSVTCKKCLVGFLSLQAFQSHVRVLHQGESCASLIEVRPEKCHLCELSFKHKEILHEHLETAHMRKLTYFCSECNLPTESPGQLINHLRDHLNECPVEIEFCHICCKVFPSKILHTKHMVLHEQAIPAAVVNTPPTRKFATNTFLTNCVTMATSFQPVIEGLQSSSEKTGENIVTNTNLETESKCQESYKTDIVKQNTLIQGKAPLKCDVCGMEGFQNKFLLQQHRVIRHLHARNRTSASYYRHIVENIKRLKSSDCMVCGKKFASGAVLKLHMKSHTKTVKTKYVCSHPGCNLKFKTKLLCLKHIKTCEHKINPTL